MCYTFTVSLYGYRKLDNLDLKPTDKGKPVVMLGFCHKAWRTRQGFWRGKATVPHSRYWGVGDCATKEVKLDP